MGDKLSSICAETLSRVLNRLGFELKSQRGSHMKFVRNMQYGKEVVVVPNHKTIRKGTLHNILKQLKLDIKQLNKLI